MSTIPTHEAQSGSPDPGSTMSRRKMLTYGAAGTLIAIGGVWYALADRKANEAARSILRPDGRPRLPPEQYLIQSLRDMGGESGDPNPGTWSLRVHGEVRKEITLDYRQLLALPQAEQICDVHCVTKWSCFDRTWKGVQIATLAEMAGVKDEARHVIFEAAGVYTANIPLKEALAPQALVAHRLDGDPLAPQHGGPVRSLVPDLYFWKSAKWLTGIRFVRDDEPGYWEVRGYHNHGDPWLEERFGA